MTDAWKHWEGQVVDGKFPLRGYLGGSGHSAVYLTEFGEPKSQAAIKLVAANPANADVRLNRWRRSAKLSHPHLIRIFQVGGCQLEETNLLYVVMEYAQEDLSQILPLRPLTADESRDMLDPVLDTLAYLHAEGFVHARLKPANIMAVDDRLKISSDGLCPVGETTAAGKPGVFDSPEATKGRIVPAADVWSLGVTLVDVLTQRLPQKNEQGEPLRLEAMPAPFLEIVRHCLRRDPEERWTVGQIKEYLGQLSSGEAGVLPSTPIKPGAKWRFVVPIAIGLLAVLVAGPRLLRHRAEEQGEQGRQEAPMTQGATVQSAQPAESKAPPSTSTEAAASPTAQAKAPEQPSAVQPLRPKVDSASGAQASGSEVVHEVVPDVPRQARNTITGKVKVNVKVHVDSSGVVTDAKFDSAGPSQYFARLAMQAAREWKFTPSADSAGPSRQWVLRFEFTRGGTRVLPVRVGS